MTQIINDEQERIDSINNGTDAIFEIDDNPNADPAYADNYAVHNVGALAVYNYGLVIEQEALAQGVDPNLVKAIMYVENAQGHYFGLSELAEILGQASSLMPMNINPNTWGGLLPEGSDPNDPRTNIQMGVSLIKEIEERLLPEDRTVENIASIYIFTGRETVNNYGARVADVYNNRAWDEDFDAKLYDYNPNGAPYDTFALQENYDAARVAFDRLQFIEEGGYEFINTKATGGILFKVVNGEPVQVDYETYDADADNPPIRFVNDDESGYLDYRYSNPDQTTGNNTIGFNSDGTLKSKDPVQIYSGEIEANGEAGAQGFLATVGDNLFDWLDDVGQTVDGFFDAVVTNVSDVVTDAGDFVSGAIGDLYNDVLYGTNHFSQRFDQLFNDSGVQFNLSLGGTVNVGTEGAYLSNREFDIQDTTFSGSFLVGENDSIRIGGSVSFDGGYSLAAGGDVNGAGITGNAYATPGGDYGIVFKLSVPLNGVYNSTQNLKSPLVLDLNGNGVELNHINSQGVFFDIDNDQYAEKVGWVDASDGMLAMDRNGNGFIDDITELYGDDVMPAFKKLAMHDSNGNGKIDQGDDDYVNLLVWQDLNQNGISEDGELKALDHIDINIKEISLSETPEATYQDENFISGRATYTKFNNSTYDIVDAHFLNDNINTWYKGAESQVFGSEVEINLEAILLPLSRGYGSMASLHIAMTNNPELKAIMKDMVALDASNLNQMSDLMESFLYEWAGVTNNDPDARTTGNGSNIDARKVDFMEQFTGVEWKQLGVSNLVGSKASIGVKKVWGEVVSVMTARILVQGTLKDIFPNAVYDFKTDLLTLGSTMADIITEAQTYISTTPEAAHKFWLNIGNILINHKDELAVTISDISDALDTAYGSPLFIDTKTITLADGDIYSYIDGSDELLETSTFVGTSGDDLITGSNNNDYIFGEGGNDTVEALGGDDFVRGDDGADTLRGGDGDDRLEGSGGNDTLEGGAGRDDLRGGTGNDILNGEDGDDKLHGGAGADTIDGGAGNDEIDYLESDKAVYVNLATNENFGGHAEGDTYVNIENITGSDNSDVLIGNAVDNLINGEKGDDVIFGGGGNDQLFGAEGNDTMFGQDGNDVFQGFEGAEAMDGGAGHDTVEYAHPFNTEGVHVDLQAGNGSSGAAKGDTYVSIENVYGSDHDDVIIGDGNSNVLSGLEGNDIIKAGAGDDLIISGGGIDSLEGGDGADVFTITPHYDGTVTILDFDPLEDIIDYKLFTDDVTSATTLDIAQKGADIIMLVDGGHMVIVKNTIIADLITANINFSASSPLQSINVAASIVAGIAQDGDIYDNKLVGNINDDTIHGNDGDDSIFGLEGDDILYGDAGNDILVGGDGADTLDGGTGNDTIEYTYSHDSVNINLETATASGGTAQGDIIVQNGGVSTIENVFGSKFDDVITGDSRANQLEGGDGDDIIKGNGGADSIFGGRGSDTFIISADPNVTSLIKDFDIQDSNETIDLSAFGLSELNIIANTSSPFVSLKLPNNQNVNLEGVTPANYHLLTSDRFGGIPVRLEIQEPGKVTTYGTDGNDTIQGSSANTVIVDGKGNDQIYFADNGNTIYKVTKNSGDLDTIYDYNTFFIKQYIYTIFEGTQTTDTLDDSHLVSSSSFSNGKIDLSQFVDIDSFNDLTLSYNDSSNYVDILLPGSQTVRIDGNSIETLIYDEPGENISKGGIGYQLNIPEILHVHTKLVLDSNNFIFYSGGELKGSLADDSLNGGKYADQIEGYDGNDTIYAHDANDTVNGGAGNDYINGEGGSDIIDGGTGNDTIVTGNGSDTITGGDDSDTYIIKQGSGTTTITDFEFWRAGEKINLTDFNSQFGSYAALRAAMSADSDVRISLGGGQELVLEGINRDMLSSANFEGNASVNTAPTASDLSDSTDEDTAFVISTTDLLAQIGANDVDGDDLTVDSVLNPLNGTVTLDAISGDITFTPNANYNGSASFEFTINDGSGGVITQTANLNIVSINDKPIVSVVNDAADGNNQITITVPDATDVEDVTVTPTQANVTLYSITTGAAVSVNSDGTISYQAPAGFIGDDTFEYTITDSEGLESDPQLVTVAVTISNNTPMGNDDSGISTNEDTPVVIPAATLLANDTDVEDDTLTITAVDNQATDGSSNVVGTVVLAGADITFTPNANYAGSAFFDYTVSDGTSADTATVEISVDALADTPVINIASASGDEDTNIDLDLGIVLADTDGSETLGDITISGVPANASLTAGTLQGNGDWIVAQNELTGLQLVPAQDFNGDINLTISVDSTEGSNSDTANATKNITVTVNAVNDAPIANDDSGISTNEDTPIVVPTATLLANDTDVESALTITSVDNQATDGNSNVVGTVVLTGTDITFTPNSNYAGSAFFDYTVSDGTSTDTATVSITVDAVADTPVISIVNASGEENTNINLDLGILLTDTDGSETLGNVTISGVPTNASLTAGTLQGNSDWIIAQNDLAGLQLVPAQDFNGDINLTISVDATEGSNSDTANATKNITVTVTPVNSIPFAENDTASVSEDSFVNINVLANDTDADNHTLSIESWDSVSDKGYTILHDGNGNFTYDAAGNFESFALGATDTDTFTYKVNDGNGGISNTATVTININGENDAPNLLLLNSNQVTEEVTGAVIATNISVGDVDIGDTHTFVVNDTSGNLDTRFEVVNGQLKLVDGVSLNHETEDGTEIEMVVTDNNGLSFSNTFTLSVNDVVETKYGTSGDDTIYCTNGMDLIFAGDGNDTIYTFDGNDAISAGDGIDTVYAGKGNDTVFGNDGDDVIYGGEGNDLLYGEGGNDQINGGADDDLIIGGADSDAISGGTGNDTVSYAGSDAAVWVDIKNATFSGGHAATDTITEVENIVGSDFADYLAGDDNANILTGGLGNDNIIAHAGDDILFGGEGNDPLFGSSGNDVIYGGNGNDALYGGSGSDIIRGEDGTDTIWGGANADIFVFENLTDSNSIGGFDTIKDFQKGVDLIDLSGLADEGITSFSDLSLGTVNFQIMEISSDNYDFKITLDGLILLTASDFVF